MSDVDQKVKDILAAQQWDPARPSPFEACESPIEKFFVAGLMVEGWECLPEWLAMRTAAQLAAGETTWELGSAVTTALADCATGSVACVQAEVILHGHGTIRVDVAILRLGGPPIALELDGFEFHDRTPEQATRDRDRDLALGVAGWRHERFTGSALNADAHRCAAAVRRIVGGLSAEERRARWLTHGGPQGLAKARRDTSAALTAAEASGNWGRDIQALARAKDGSR